MLRRLRTSTRSVVAGWRQPVLMVRPRPFVQRPCVHPTHHPHPQPHPPHPRTSKSDLPSTTVWYTRGVERGRMVMSDIFAVARGWRLGLGRGWTMGGLDVDILLFFLDPSEAPNPKTRTHARQGPGASRHSARRTANFPWEPVTRYLPISVACVARRHPVAELRPAVGVPAQATLSDSREGVSGSGAGAGRSVRARDLPGSEHHDTCASVPQPGWRTLTWCVL